MSSRTPISSLPPSDSDLPPAGAASAPAAGWLRCGYIALAGRPNAGKSTLFNALLGQRLSIVTSKPQTTRSRILGILTRPESQMIFLDTPGLLEPSYRLHHTMARQIERCARDADVVLLLVDATRIDDRCDLIRQFLSRLRAPVVTAVNKADRVEGPDELEEICARVRRSLSVQSVVAISALKGHNLDSMSAELESHLPFGPQLYPEDMVAEQPERFFAAELIREAAFNRLADELPYSIEVAIEEFVEPSDGAGAETGDDDGNGRPAVGKIYLAATLYVERESQKRIVIGRKGSRLRRIGREARLQIEALLGREVYLDLWVKTRTDWRNRARDLREFGYE